ncbi:MAG: A/G-specific adenine glycosylase [bacterium]|nr:A/G-specific adenine glycosylase [bacterium]
MTAAQVLLAWYRKHGRDLPWRHTHDAYAILVSEIMLQQTQVPRVILFYEKWLKQFPTWQALANASNADVIRAWAGLGYNRRALVLRDIARSIDATQEPKNEEEWRRLKGIGPYTAAAVSAFALHQRTLPIDTNIRRVLDRLLLGVLFPDPALDNDLRKKTDAFLPRSGHYFDIPQALFDLATAICTKEPNCAACPLNKLCPSAKKFLAGNVQAPKAMIKKAVEKKHAKKPHPDRIYRGRILGLVRTRKTLTVSAVGPLIDPTFQKKDDAQWVINMIERLVKDGFLKKNNNRLTLA